MKKEESQCSLFEGIKLCALDPYNGPAMFWEKVGNKAKKTVAILWNVIFAVLCYLVVYISMTSKFASIGVVGNILILLSCFATPVLYSLIIYALSLLFKGKTELWLAVFSSGVSLRPLSLAMLLFIILFSFGLFNLAGFIMILGLVLTSIQVYNQLSKTHELSNLVAFLGTPLVVFLTDFLSKMLSSQTINAFINLPK